MGMTNFRLAQFEKAWQISEGRSENTFMDDFNTI